MNPTSIKILTDYSNKVKADKDLLTKQLSEVISQIDALQLNKRSIQKQVDDCNTVINDLKADLES